MLGTPTFRLEPPRLLEHSWFENIPPAAVIAWILEPEGDGCRLTLTHSAGPVDDAPRTAAGWTMILQSLARELGEVTYTWVPRSRNAHADRLANEAMDAQAGRQR